MAKAEELDLDTTAKESGAVAKKGGRRLMLLIVVGMLLVSGLVFGTLYFTGMLGGGDASADANAHDNTAEKRDHKQAVVPVPAAYLDMKPVLVSNFEDQSAGASYLQIDMQLMARDPHALDIAKLHMPVIRNNLLLIMSSQKVADVKTRAGKEKLQQTMLEAIQKVIAEAATNQHGNGKEDAANSQSKDKHEDKSKEGGHSKTANIDAVYFTSFILQ
jgi:flagellar protein FliL